MLNWALMSPLNLNLCISFSLKSEGDFAQEPLLYVPYGPPAKRNSVMGDTNRDTCWDVVLMSS